MCHRCLGYGHGTIGCYRKPKCVKCAKDHLTKDCPTSELVNPKCGNCGADHPANFTGCPKYQERLEEIEKLKALRKKVHKVNNVQTSTRAPEPEVQPQGSASTSTQSYATRVRIQTEPQVKTTQAQKDIMPTTNKGLEDLEAKTKNIMNDTQKEYQSLKRHYSNMAELNTEVAKIYEICNLSEMLKFLKTFRTKLEACTSEGEKRIVVLEHFSPSNG